MRQVLAKANAVQVLESLWCFKRVNTTAGELRDHFKQLIDGDDRLSVAEVTQWATYNTLGTPKDIWEPPGLVTNSTKVDFWREYDLGLIQVR
jgi:hypothetical protein